MFSLMRTIGSPAELERRRLLAVERVNEGYSTEEVAAFLGIDASSVRRWVSVFGRHGIAGLRARPVPGRPPKLTRTREKLVFRWLADNPTAYGFATELWTAPRLAQLIEQEWGVSLHPRYLCQWLRARGFTPQKPRRVGRERNDQAIAVWLAQDWPRIKKRPAGGTPPWFSWTKPGC
jgi:transposase